MAQCWRRCGFQLALASSVLVGGASAIFGDCVLAQITPDGTLPNNSIVTPQSNTSIISGGTKAGSNLFHSFAQFSVPTGSTAHFNNAADVQNIFSRVTGRSISNIDGLIQANGTANLFLLNPNGIIFGPNAELNIGGSFLASTASAVNFADGTQFSATATQTTPLLTVTVPLGLQYGGNAGSILNQSQATNSIGEAVGLRLQVQPGKILALVGGDVSVDDGILQAPGGRVELGGVTGAGTVGLNVDGNDLGLNFPDGVERADVALINGSRVDVTAGDNGSIAINARNLDLVGGSRLQAGLISGMGSINSQAGNIDINATGETKLADYSLIANESLIGATGSNGDINITTGSLAVSNLATLTTINYGQGNAGNVNINARDTVFFDGRGSGTVGIFTSAYFNNLEGNNGNINITARALSVTNGTRLDTSTFGKGNAGSVNINVRDTVTFDRAVVSSYVGLGSPGNGGNINITAGSFFLTNGAGLGAGTAGQGNAGSVNINARDTVTIDGVSNQQVTTFNGFNISNEGIPSGVFNSTRFNAIGNGGNINITAKSVSVTNGAQIAASTLGKGNAGSVNIHARDTITFNGVSSKGNPSGTFTNVESTAMGNGGSINITAKSLTLTNGALLSSSNIKSNEDNAEFALRPTFSENPAFLSSNTTAGQGNIFVRSRYVLLRSGSSIITNAIGAAIGGNIIIDSDILATLEDTSITANAQEAFGGRVIINAQAIFRTQDNDITATSELGTEFSGTVELNTPEIDPSRGLATLPTELVEVSGLITSSCAAVGESKFTITGRGGLPPSPNEVLSSDAVWVDWGTLNPRAENRSSPTVSTNPTAPEPAPIVEARSWVINDEGEVILTANAPTTTPYSPWITSATCHTPQASS